MCPDLLENKDFPPDVVARAKRYLTMTKSFGGYTHSKGLEGLRLDVGAWLERRDGYSASCEDIYLTNGASSGVVFMLEALIRDRNDGVMIPIPQYPLYSATITRLDGTAVNYYLKESEEWGVNMTDVKQNLAEARKKGINVRVLVVINPSNPTGTVLDLKTMQQLVTLCEVEGLVLFADEVYQDNVYGEVPFISFRKVARDMGSPVELVSFHSASKGYYGECGLRGGLMHLENFDEAVKAQLYKLASAGLCSNTMGQALMTAIVNPPIPGDASFESFSAERDVIMSSLKRKAKLIEQRLNSIPGVSTQRVTGAMYAFPSIDLSGMPEPADGKAKDAVYCMKMLEETGIVTVPGSGFGQQPGTHHFRITILPDEQKLPQILDRFE
eukprot:Selendium_serpulae@DN6034_c0_g1_i1.p1